MKEYYTSNSLSQLLEQLESVLETDKQSEIRLVIEKKCHYTATINPFPHLYLDEDGYVCFMDSGVFWTLHFDGWEAFLDEECIYQTCKREFPKPEQLQSVLDIARQKKEDPKSVSVYDVLRLLDECKDYVEHMAESSHEDTGEGELANRIEEAREFLIRTAS
jgi:hypothetical protein